LGKRASSGVSQRAKRLAFSSEYMDEETVRTALAAAHTAALKVGDSPLRADRVSDDVQKLVRILPSAGLGEERTVRIAALLNDALRVLRRDEDGREAAKHLQSALRMFEPPQRAPSPFLD